ncbi:MAG TPA: LysR family transcriptional regulator, partial [Methylophilaceae bacterium]
MTLSELRYIVAVSRERNFRRAAERCFVTQPALSLAIQKLEADLGVQIFERKKRDVSLTAVGEHIVEQAAKVLEEADKVKDIARLGASPL